MVWSVSIPNSMNSPKRSTFRYRGPLLMSDLQPQRLQIFARCRTPTLLLLGQLVLQLLDPGLGLGCGGLEWRNKSGRQRGRGRDHQAARFGWHTQGRPGVGSRF